MVFDLTRMHSLFYTPYSTYFRMVVNLKYWNSSQQGRQAEDMELRSLTSLPRCPSPTPPATRCHLASSEPARQPYVNVP